MCSLLTNSTAKSVLDVREAYAEGSDGIGAALIVGGRLQIMKNISLELAEMIATSGLPFRMHFRNAGPKSKGPRWCQPFLTPEGQALFMIGSRSVMRDVISDYGIPNPLGQSPVKTAAHNWSEELRYRLSEAGIFVMLFGT